MRAWAGLGVWLVVGGAGGLGCKDGGAATADVAAVPAAGVDAAVSANADAGSAPTGDTGAGAATDMATGAGADTATGAGADAATSAGADTGSAATDDTGAGADAATGADSSAAQADTAEAEYVEPWAKVAPAAVPPPTPTTGACVPGAGQPFSGTFTWPELAGRALELCVNLPEDPPEKPTCYALDLDTAKVDKLEKLPARFVRAAAGDWSLPSAPDTRLSKDKKKAEARIGAGPKAPFKRLETGAVGVDRIVSNDAYFATSPSAWTDDLSLVPEAKIMTFARETGAKVAEIPIESLESPCPVIWFAGELLYVEAGVCAGPGAVGFFIDPATGKVVQRLGGGERSASAYGVQPVPLDDGHIAFREQYGNALFVHDRKTAAVLKTLNLTATLARGEDGLPVVEPEGGAMFALKKAEGPIESLVVLQKDRVAVIDPANWAVTRLIVLTGCPPTE